MSVFVGAPDGFLDALAAATGKSRPELKFRRQFAERFPTTEALATAVANVANRPDVDGRPGGSSPPRPRLHECNRGAFPAVRRVRR